MISQPIDETKILYELSKDKTKQFKFTLNSKSDMKNYVLNNPDLDLNRINSLYFNFFIYRFFFVVSSYVELKNNI